MLRKEQKNYKSKMNSQNDQSISQKYVTGDSIFNNKLDSYENVQNAQDDNVEDGHAYQVDKEQYLDKAKINPKILFFIIFCIILLIAYIGVSKIPGRVPVKHFHKKISKVLHTLDPLLDLKYNEDNFTKNPTSSQIKFAQVNQSTSILQQIKKSLSSKKFANQKNFKRTNPLNKSLKMIKQQTIAKIAQKASARLKNPQYPSFMYQINNYSPYQDLPFCLFVKQTQLSGSRKYDQQVAKSIFALNYSNYITIFYSSDEKHGLKQAQLSLIELQSSALKNITNRMYFKIILNSTDYYSYKYLMHSLCADKSFVMFVNNPIKNTTLTSLNKYHQLFPVYITISETPTQYVVHSFAMRIFDLVDLNDFNGTNSQFLEKPNSQALFSTAIIELSKLFTKKFPLAEIYETKLKPNQMKWTTAINKTDKTIYKQRQEYQYLFQLSQAFKFQKIEQMEKKLKQLKQLKPNTNTQLNPNQIIDAFVKQQALFLPSEYSLNLKQYRQIDNKYGPRIMQQKPIPSIFQEKHLCVAVLGGNQKSYHNQRKQRILTCLQSIFKQNYTKFNVYLYDDGLTPKTLQSISEILKQTKFPTHRYTYNKNVPPKPPIYNIINNAFTQCSQNDLQIVIDSDFQIIGPNYFQLINYFKIYNPQVWVIHANYKTDNLKFGTAYRINRDSEYRDVSGRVNNLNYLSPLSAWEVKLVRSIPLEYHFNRNGTWQNKYWHKSLMHSLSELATVSHIQYLPQILHDASSLQINQIYNYSNITDPEMKHILSLPILKPLTSLRSKFMEFEKKILNQVGKNKKK